MTPMLEIDNKSPSHQTTRPLGNSDPQPDPLARGINANAAAKMARYNPDAVRAVRGVVERKRHGSGHARG
jgi:hypothetical protein